MRASGPARAGAGRVVLLLRATPLTLPAGLGLGLMAATTLLGLSRPFALGLGPGYEPILSGLFREWLGPLAACTVLFLGTAAWIEALHRRRGDGSARLGPPLSPLHEAATELVGLAVGATLLSIVLALPFVWMQSLSPQPLGAWLALLGRLAAAAAGSVALAWGVTLRSPGFGRSVLRAGVLLGLGLAAWGGLA